MPCVLFLDELPEFNKNVLEVMNKLLESSGKSTDSLNNLEKEIGYTFKDIERMRFDGRGGSVSKFTVKKDGKVTVSYINQCVF